MPKSLFNVHVFRKYLDIFRRKRPIGREAYLLAGNNPRHFSRNYLTSLHRVGKPSSASRYITNPITSSTPEVQAPALVEKTMLPNHRLLARAFHRVYPSSTPRPRAFSTTAVLPSKTDDKSNSSNWTGRHTDEHIVQTDDTHNVQKDASDSGFAERAKGGESNSGAISERDGKNANQKAKEEHPEAPGPVLGMNDERGGKGQ